MLDDYLYVYRHRGTFLSLLLGAFCRSGTLVQAKLLLAIGFDVLICFRTASVKSFLPFLLISLWLVWAYRGRSPPRDSPLRDSPRSTAHKGTAQLGGQPIFWQDEWRLVHAGGRVEGPSGWGHFQGVSLMHRVHDLHPRQARQLTCQTPVSNRALDVVEPWWRHRTRVMSRKGIGICHPRRYSHRTNGRVI